MLNLIHNTRDLLKSMNAVVFDESFTDTFTYRLFAFVDALNRSVGDAKPMPG